MTKKEKEHKLKLIYLIMIVSVEYSRRKPFKDIWEAIAFSCECVWWAKEAERVRSIPTFESGCIVVSKYGVDTPLGE